MGSVCGWNAGPVVWRLGFPAGWFWGNVEIPDVKVVVLEMKRFEESSCWIGCVWGSSKYGICDVEKERIRKSRIERRRRYPFCIPLSIPLARAEGVMYIKLGVTAYEGHEKWILRCSIHSLFKIVCARCSLRHERHPWSSSHICHDVAARLI